MKKFLLLILAGVCTFYLVEGQPSYADSKLRDKTLNEGIAFAQKGEYELASSRVSRCLELDSTFAPAWLLRGQLLLEWGIMEDARAAFQQAQQYDPSLGEAYFYEAYLLYDTDTTGEDRKLIDLAIENGFHKAWSYYIRALMEIRDGSDDLAMEDLIRAIELKEDFALAYHERAGIKRRRGDLQGAHFDYQQAIASDPDFALAYNNLGSVKMLLGDYKAAIENYTKAIELDPELVIALNNRGYARYFTDDKEGALVDFNAAIIGGDQLAPAKLNKAALLVEQGQLVSALKLLDESLAEHPENAMLYLNRGLVRELNGDLAGACEDWNQAISLGAEKARDFINECDR